MLKKLLKYEWKAVSPMLGITHTVVFLLSITGFLIMTILQTKPMEGIFGGLYTTVFFLSIVCIYFFTYIYLAIRYYRNIYTDEGYLTNTLPVTSGQLLWSKFIIALLWSVLDAFILMISCCILFQRNFFRDFLELFQTAIKAGYLPFVIFGIVLVIFSFISTILELYCSISLGSLFPAKKVLGSIVSYVLWYFINQAVALVLILVTMGKDLFLETEIYSDQIEIGAQSPAAEAVIRSFTAYFIGLVILTVIFSVIYYLISHYILNKKLNLE